MPRSNKKKHVEQRAVPTGDGAVALLLCKERTLMINRAKVNYFILDLGVRSFIYFQASAHRHGIQLKQGAPNPGTGDCAFQATISNINDRSCFEEQFTMSVDWYRRIFVTDMANRTVNTPYNTMSSKEWYKGWSEMLAPGAYERGIFGDLMLPGIACAIRKYILIFNTNLNTPHDPIYVVDPTSFNVIPDTEIPVVLSYNLTHYESMEPCTEVDVKMTRDLVQQYLSGRYRYRKQDMPYLISSQEVRRKDKLYIDTIRSNKREKNEPNKMA